MRDIKFRGRMLDTNAFIYGTGVAFVGPKAIIITSEFNSRTNEDGGTVYPVYPESVQQYIGIDDTEGNPIYEGDFITMRDCYWNEDEDKSKINPNGFIEYSGTCFGVFCGGRFYGIDSTPWKTITVKPLS